MLVTKYHGLGADAIYKWLTTSTTETSISPFLKALKQFAPNGIINDRFIKNEGYAELSFVKNLANAEGLYRRITTQQMALGLNGKKLFSISQNSTISKICDDLSIGDRNSQFIKTLLGFGYNLYDDGLSKRGSIIARYIAEGKPIDLRLFTFIGSKSDNKGDTGSSYTEQATVDDYMAKLAMLQSGSIIMPTLADKSMYQAMDTYGVDGQKLDIIPGMKFVTTKPKIREFDQQTQKYVERVDKNAADILGVTGAPKIAFMGKYAYLRPNDDVLRQMIEYAVTEKVAIERCIEDLKTLKDEEKIKNYHTVNKDKDTGKTVEPNGTRFLVFTEIVTMKNGKAVTINFNDPNESSERMLQRANDEFFSKPIEEQMTIMAQTLAMQTAYEVQKAEDLGLVSRTDISIHNLVTGKDGKPQQKEVIRDRATNRSSLLNITSDQLNKDQINAVMQQLLASMPDSWKALNKPETLALYNERRDAVRSMAIAAILQDATLRSIISSQEVLRCFCGHPGMFKVTYDFKNSIIKDSTFDLQKRIGGMISTGDDNVLDLPNMKRTYTCAEIKDYEVGLPENALKSLQDKFETGMLADLYYRHAYVDRSENVDLDIAMRVKNHELIPEQFKTDEQKAKWFKFVDNTVDKAKQYADAYKDGINVADGAAYITADMCRDMLRMNGKLDAKAVRALQILTDENTQYSWMQSAQAYKDIYDAINITPTKYTAYGFREHTVNDSKCSDVAVPYYNKFALFPIFPCMATGSMYQLYEKMKNEGVDMALMDSAVKVGSQGAVKYNGKSIDVPFNTYTQEFSFIRKQLNTDPEEGSTTAVGSQVMKVGLQNLILNKVYQDFQTGENIIGQQIYDNIMNTVNKLAKIGVKEITDRFMENGVCNQKKLSEYLNEQLNAKNASNTTIEAIQTHKENGVDVLNMPLAATSDASWIESIIISLMKKEVIDINAPGSSFIQRSVFAIEQGGNPYLSINDGKKLKMINENGSMDCILSMDYFTDVLFANNMIGKTFEEQRQWLIDNKIIGNTEDVKANTIGYRVPTQAQSSIHSLRCVDVLPASKNTIILPEEFTKITGADFDIDHLYLWSYNYSIGKSGEATLSTESDKKRLQNDLLTNMLTLINSVENSMHFLYKTVDTDTGLLRNVSDKLQGATSYKHHAFNFGTLHEQIDRKNDYITGKIGIGPYALNVTNQELTRLAKVKFAETIVTKSTRISKLDNMVDVDDNPIASWESGYINGHVDIVKDPFITSLNINQFTYNLSNLLTRCGFSETTLWFICQPIIKKMAAASNGANGQYTRDGSRSTYSIKETAIAKACAEVTGKDEAALVDLLDKIKNPSTKEDYRYIAKCINYIEENAGLLQKVAIETDKDPNIEEVTYAKEGGVEAKYNVKDVQLQVLKAYTALDKYQKSLGKLVQYTKIDTKNYGKSLIQTRRYLKIYKNLVHPDERDKSIFDMDSIDRLINNTWIEYKTENAIMLPFQILGGQVFNANDTFVNEVLSFADILGTSEDITEDMVNELSKSVITAIKSAYIINYAKTFDDGQHIKPKTDADIAKMFTSQNALSKRLNRLLDQIRNNPNYKRLAGNYLLQSITAEFEEDPIIADGKLAQRPSFISISSNVGDNKRNSDMFSEAWEDLLNDDDPFVRNFANDLIIYSFLTSGEYNGWTHMFKYVPYSWRVGETKGFDHKVETFANFIKRMLAGGLSEIVNRDILDDVVANNFMNNSIIRSSRIIDQDGNLNFATNRKGNIAIGKWVEDIAEAPTYITLRKPGTRGKNQDDYRLYKLAAFYENHPVYAEIIKRGYHHKGYDIYEYGWDFNYIENKSTNSMLYEDEINEAVKKLEQDENTPITDDLNKLISIVSSEVNKVVNERKDNDGSSIVQTDEKAGTTQSEYVMQSGGAPGSDTIWGQIASEFGVTKQNHWYHGERNSKNSPGGNIQISQEDYEEGKYKVAAAAKMNWGYQYDTMKDDRLIRNWAQVKYADAVFAVGHIVGKGQRVFPNQANDTRVASTTVVQGGTGYAVGMAIIEGKPVYVFDQERGKWASCINGQWKWLDETPTLTKQFAGIGTREINDAGRQAIRDVFEKTFNENNGVSDTTQEVQNAHFYSGDVTPEPNVIFVFGSNTEGKHGAGAAALAKSEFGAIQGQAEGLQGNSYAIITKDLKKAKEASWSYLGRSEDWYKPGQKEENHIKWWYNPPKAVEKGTVPKGYTESTYDGYPALKFKKGISPRHADNYYFVKNGKYFYATERMDRDDNWGFVSEERNVGQIPEEVVYYFEGQSEKDHYSSVSMKLYKIYGSYGPKDFKGHDYSEVYDHPLNERRSIKPEQILESIKKMYDVARQNPDKIFKVSNYKSGKISLNGYLGEEMMQLFIDAGPIPNNVQFNEEWSDVMYNHYEDNNKLNNNNDSELSEDEQREAQDYKKACEGE